MNAPSKDRALVWTYLLGGWSVIAAIIFAYDPALLNYDTFEYIATANCYFHTPVFQIHDVYTVGPVIPLLIALLKGIGQAMFGWSRDLDIAVVKICTLGCYLTTTLSMVVYGSRRGVSQSLTAFVVLLVLFTLPVHYDVISLNAELVCSSLFGLFVLVASGAVHTRRRRVALIALAILIVYTKLQAVVLLGVCIFTLIESSDRSKFVIRLLASILVIEALLFFVGGGWMPKFAPLISYVAAGHTADAQSSGTYPIWVAAYEFTHQHLGIAWWAISQSLTCFPLALPLILATTIMRKPEVLKEQGHSAKLWAIATVITIIVPGRPFDHYLLFWLPFIVLFLPAVISERPFRVPCLGMAVPLIALLAMTKFVAVRAIEDASPNQGQAFGHRSYLSGAIEKAAAQIHMGASDTMFVHGWDYRYYCYFNKARRGPGVIEGSKHPLEYAAEILTDQPTYIFDIINHSGLVRDNRFALAAHPFWSRALGTSYTKVFDQDGLVIYRKTASRVAPPSNPVKS